MYFHVEVDAATDDSAWRCSWGIIGQYMVPGASNALIRSTSYFPDADATRQWWVLGAWTAFGVALALVGHYRDRATMRVSAGTLE